MAAAQAAENHGDKWGLTYLQYLQILTRRDIYIISNVKPLTEFTSSSTNTGFKDTIPWNISQMITKTIPISMRIFISHAIVLGLLESQWKLSNIRISQWRGSHCRTNTSIIRKKEIQKSRAVRVTVRDLSRKINHLSKVICDRKIITFHQVYQFHQNGLASPYGGG